MAGNDSAPVGASVGPSEPMSLTLAAEPEIKSLIYTVRGQQAMLDSDLARLYGVETKVLNQAAKRNQDRFPEDFRFQLTDDEYDNLRSQIVTSSDDLHEFASGGRRYMPIFYTEMGVAMLSAVLRSKVAVETSVHIMRAFVEMRRFMANNAAMFEHIRALEQQQTEDRIHQLEYQKTTDERFERVFDYMETHDAPRQKLFFEGQVYDAFELLVGLVQRAAREIVLIDNYVDTATLNILSKKAEGVEVAIHTHPHTRLTQADIEAFNLQYPWLTVRHTKAFHDRYLILDGAEGYFIGASLKDAGKKSFAVTRIEDPLTVQALLDRLVLRERLFPGRDGERGGGAQPAALFRPLPG